MDANLNLEQKPEGIKTFHDRYIDNGVLDFLLKEREEGRIRNLGWSFHGSRDIRWRWLWSEMATGQYVINMIM